MTMTESRPAPSEPPEEPTPTPPRDAKAWVAKHSERIGLTSLLAVCIIVIGVGAGWVTGALALFFTVMAFVVVVGFIWAALMSDTETRRRLAPYGLLKPGMLWLSLFFLAPLWIMLSTSLSTRDNPLDFTPKFDWNFQNYRDAFTDFGPQFQRAFGYSAMATVLCIVIGYPLAYVIAFRGGKYRNLLLGLVVIPFFTSYLIRTLAWQSILADSGPVVKTIKNLHLRGLFESLHLMQDGRVLSTSAAVIGGLTYNFLPFMILPIYVSLEKIDLRLVDAAKDLYSGTARSFLKVVLPLSLPGVFAGTLLTFIPAAGDFVNAAFLGGPNNTMIGNSIQDQYLNQVNYPLASAMSFVLMVIITIAVLVYTKLLGTEELA